MKVNFNKIKNKIKTNLNFIYFLPLFFLVACQEPYKLGFDLLLPENTDFLSEIHKVNVVLGDKISQTQINSAEDFHINSTFKVKPGSLNKLEIKGYDQNDNLVAYGVTPPFIAVDAPGVRLSVFFNKINTFGQLKTENKIPAIGTSPVVFRSDSNENTTQNIIGYLFFGGIKNGMATDEVWFYDPYFQSESSMHSLSIKRSNMSVMPVSSEMIFLYGGFDEHGDISNELWFYSASCSASCSCQKLDWAENSADSFYVADTKTVRLGPFENITDNTNGDKLIDAYLIFGGVTYDASSQIVTDPNVHLILMYTDNISQTLKLKHLLYNWTNARRNFATETAKKSSNENKIIVYGGNAPTEIIKVKINSETDGLSYEVNFSEINSEYQPLNPASTKTVGGKPVFFGGETSDGTILTETFWFDDSTNELKPLNKEVSAIKDGVAATLGQQILITGGNNTTSDLITYEETENSLSITEVEQIQNLYKRENPVIFALPTSNIAVYGGTFNDEPLKNFEILTLNPRDTEEATKEAQ